MENVVKAISGRQAVATVNEWLASPVSDRFIAGTPALDKRSHLWLVPFVYNYPKEGPLGSIGEIAARD